MEESSKTLADAFREGGAEAVQSYLEPLEVDDMRRELDRLSSEDRRELMVALPPGVAGDLLEDLAEAQAIEILEDFRASEAAPIISALPDDISADFLREMGDDETEAILGHIAAAAPEAGAELRERVAYDDETAGALMESRFVAFDEKTTVGEVLTELSERAEEYSDRDVQYVYVTGGDGILVGVLPLRTLVLTRRAHQVSSIMLKAPVSVNVSDDLEALEDVFESAGYLGLPVLDDAGMLRGVVLRAAVEEARADHYADDYLKSAGILGGEELRSLPLVTRSRRRLAWLAPNIILNLAAASVISMFEDTLQAVIALAVFLPIVSDMSGCAGNQAVAVSIRELALGIVRPTDFVRVIWKEVSVGLINGVVLGCILGSIAWMWKGSLALGLVIAGALSVNCIVSVLIGGLVPLLLKRFKADPALASGPILTTCTDVCGFFLVLGLASTVIDKLPQ